MKITIFAPLVTVLATLNFVAAAPYPITHTDTLNCRDKPSTSGRVVRTYGKSADIKISCQTTGDNISGNNIWDKTSDGCYVADYYVKTGVNGFIPGVNKCGSGSNPSPGGKVPGPRKDDYKYKSSCGGVDPWNYYKCQCTSFVAQRINERLGIHFTNRYKGAAWGNANSWDEAAKRTGVRINSTPKPGCVAQTNAGSAGHVAWVSAVEGNNVIIEEYNFARREGYGTRKVPKNRFNYIHLTSST